MHDKIINLNFLWCRKGCMWRAIAKECIVAVFDDGWRKGRVWLCDRRGQGVCCGCVRQLVTAASVAVWLVTIREYVMGVFDDGWVWLCERLSGSTLWLCDWWRPKSVLWLYLTMGDSKGECGCVWQTTIGEYVVVVCDVGRRQWLWLCVCERATARECVVYDGRRLASVTVCNGQWPNKAV